MEYILIDKCGRCGTEYTFFEEDIEYECGCGNIIILKYEEEKQEQNENIYRRLKKD